MNIFKCVECGKEIGPERLEGLQYLGITDTHAMTCLECAEHSVTKVKGIWTGESGASPLMLVNKVSDKDGIDRN